MNKQGIVGADRKPRKRDEVGVAAVPWAAPLDRKRPGRPKKNTALNSIDIQGIGKAPLGEGNVLEMIYRNPRSVFKKIFNMYKAYNINEIPFTFLEDQVIIHCTNEGGNIDAVLTFCGARLPHYYCEQPRRVTVKRDDLEKIFKAINKYQDKISFFLKADSVSTFLDVVLYDKAMDKEDCYSVEIISSVEDVDLRMPDDSAYPLSFALPAKHLKEVIINCLATNDNLTIQKAPGGPLELCNDSQNRLTCYSSYKNPNKIRLKYTGIDKFTTSIITKHLKPFADLCIGLEVACAVDEKEKISLTTDIDPVYLETVDGAASEGPSCQLKVFCTVEQYTIA